MILARENRPTFQALLERAHEIGEKIARPAADEVDRDARFPHEAFAALRKERLLSAAIPEELGGFGCSVDEIAQICTALGQHCSATAMIYAMHKIQVATLVRFGQGVPYFRAALVELAERQLLIASVTSEVGVGGDLRTSIAAVERDGDRFKLEKKASVISYGEQADALLLSARRAPDAAGNDQVFVYLKKGDYQLQRTSVWNTFGMRGTCSPGFVVRAQGSVEQVVPTPFADIAAQTQVPYSHMVWTSLWLGIATDAVTRAHAFVRADARKRPGTLPFNAQRMALMTTKLHTLRASIHDGVRAYAAALAAPDAADALSDVGCAIRWNSLKVSASNTVVDIVHDAMVVCGMAGYANDSKFSMGRQLRDAISTQVMIANDRILNTNSSLLLIYKED